MIDSPLMIGGDVIRTRTADRGADAGGPHLDPAFDDIPIRPATPAVDWGIELYEKSLAAYSPTPLPVRLRVLASEYDGREWARLSPDSELREIPGVHFDLVTVRIDDLASNLRSWLSGSGSTALGERRPFAPASKDETSLAGSSKQQSQQSLARDHEDKAPAPATSHKEMPPVGAAKHESLSRRLRRFLNYARR